MRRRDFVKGIVGSAVSWPLAARAQQGERMRLIGVLSNRSSGDAQGREAAAAFAERYRTYAAELVAQAPDVLLANSYTAVHTFRPARR